MSESQENGEATMASTEPSVESITYDLNELMVKDECVIVLGFLH